MAIPTHQELKGFLSHIVQCNIEEAFTKVNTISPKREFIVPQSERSRFGSSYLHCALAKYISLPQQIADSNTRNAICTQEVLVWIYLHSADF